MSTAVQPEDLRRALAGFRGSAAFHRHWTGRGLYTDGVQYLAETARAYWLIDVIVSWQLKPKVQRERFQVWTVKVNRSDHTAIAEGWDDTPGTSNRLARQKIEFTDFPLDEITLFFCDGTLLLPSEY